MSETNEVRGRFDVDELYEALCNGESQVSLVERMSGMSIEESEGDFRLDLAKKAGELAYCSEMENANIVILEELRQYAVGSRAAKFLSKKLTELVGGNVKVVSEANFGSVHRGGGIKAGMLGHGVFQCTGLKDRGGLLAEALLGGEFEGIVEVQSADYENGIARFSIPIVCLLNMDVRVDPRSDEIGAGVAKALQKTIDEVRVKSDDGRGTGGWGGCGGKAGE
ncbi:MAG: hypothetical protein GWP15_01460 [Nitrospirae bacterium]|nr:hypothetical protein [Nitrospirota bacterium]